MSLTPAVETSTSAGGMGWPAEVVHAIMLAVEDGAASDHGHVVLPDGSVLLLQRVAPAPWAVLAPPVAARAELGDLPLVSQLDDAGLRECLRDAAVASVGGE